MQLVLKVAAAIFLFVVLLAFAVAVMDHFEVSLAALLIQGGIYISLFITAISFSIYLIEWINVFSTRPLFSKLLEGIRTNFPDRAQIGLLAMGTAVTLHALSYYQQQTTFNILTALEARDSATRASYLQGDGETPFGGKLLNIFAELPPELEIDDMEQCTAGVRSKILTWQREYFKRVAGFDPGPWQYISELFDTVWSSSSEVQAESTLARTMVMHAIDYLYLVHDAVHANDLGYFTTEQTGMWTAYLDDLTPSPFFLLALRDSGEYPYMMGSVGDKFRAYYMHPDRARIRCVMDAIYPEFLKNPVAIERGPYLLD